MTTIQPRLFVVVLLAVSLAQAKERLEPTARVLRLAEGRYEIELRYSGWALGGPCKVPLLPWKYHSSNWLYVSSLEGAWSPPNVIVTRERRRLAAPWSFQDMRGTVSISKGVLTVNLEYPGYPDGVHPNGYVAYKLNGAYRIELISAPNN